MARKMKTMDGNHAAAHASYAFSFIVFCILSCTNAVIFFTNKKELFGIFPLQTALLIISYAYPNSHPGITSPLFRKDPSWISDGALSIADPGSPEAHHVHGRELRPVRSLDTDMCRSGTQ